jgi:chromosome partitioning protein
MRDDVELGLYLYQKDVADLFGITPQGVNKIIKEYHLPTMARGGRVQTVPPATLRALLDLKGIKPYRGKIGVHIVKGGVGKTTIVHGLASRAVALGHKVLMVDLDQQGNLSHSFGVWPQLGKDPTLLNVYDRNLNGRPITIKESIVKLTPNLHLIPANLSLANLDSALLMGTENLGNLFKEIFAPVENDYDAIFFDCPPALSKVTAAVHCFVDKIVMPVNADAFSIEGLQLTHEHLGQMRKKFGAKPELRIVLNKFHAQHKMTLEVLKALSDNFSQHLSQYFISATKQIENSLAEGQCIWTARNKNAALEDMHNFLVELMALERWKDEWKSKKVAPPSPGKSKIQHEMAT